MAVHLAANPATDPEAGLAAGLLGERLTVGDFATSAWNIYRQRFKSFLRISLQANLWLLVPVYGWAKFCAGLGLIARLAFNEASARPEPLSDTRRIAEANQWNILLAGFLCFLIMGGVGGAALLAGAILMGIVAAIAGVGDALSPAVGLIFGFLALVGVLLWFAGLSWLVARLFTIELPLMVEERPDPAKAISRSWQLTKSSAWRIVTITFVTGLLTFPIGFILQIVLLVGAGLLAALGSSVPALAELAAVLTFALNIALSIVPSILFMPFWQTLKSLVYADLRDRREGLGLQIACEERRAKVSGPSVA